MELPKGFHREVIEAKESNTVDFTEASLKKRVEISPLKPGGSNFKTHTLIEKSSSQLRYRPSIGGALFSLVFLSVGLGLVIYNLFWESGLQNSPSLFNFFGFAIGLIFCLAGGFFVFYLFMPRIFDKQLGYYLSLIHI